jgi:hypothetical protein
MLRPDDPPLPDDASVDKADGSAFGTIFWAALIIDTAPGEVGAFSSAILSPSSTGQGL